MTGIALPGEDRLPPGPHRSLLEALHDLYEGAGKPGLRRISAGINSGEYRDTVSHEKVGALLRGADLPGCLKVECVVRQLAAWHNPRLDPDQEAARFTALWLAADRVRSHSESHFATATARVSAFPASDPPGSTVRGREELLHRLSRGLDPRHSPGRPQILVGDAGIGKSTIAYSVKQMARLGGPQHKAWWVSAADEESLSHDLTRVARDLGVGEAVWARLGTRPVADLSDVADRVWEMLEHEQPGWLLVIDNADDPAILGPQDGTGWIRRTRRGLVLLTTRDSDEASWPGADQIRVGPLRPKDAAQVLTDLAPAAGDRSAAQVLAQRLGYVPLALELAGMYLRRDFGPGRTFDEYRHALGHANTPELSLDALGRAGFSQARPLLWLLACYAPSSPIPEEIITGGMMPVWRRSDPVGAVPPLAGLLDPDQALPAVQLADLGRVDLRELQSAGLIDRSKSDDGRRVIRVHVSIAEDARAVMNGEAAASRPDPALVQASAAAAACAFVNALDTGSAEHWPYFRVMTPHVEELLRHTAGHLALHGRRDLLTCMVRCIEAHIWSKAEQLAEQLSLKAMTLAVELGCQDQDVYLCLRHMHALARREQGWLNEAARDFQDILAAQLRIKDGLTPLDTLYTRRQLAWTLGRLGRWAEAEEGLREVIRVLDECLGQRGTEGLAARILRLHARCMTSWCVGRQGRWAEAEQGYRQLVTDRAEIIGPEHPDTLDAAYNIGKTLAWQGKWAAAENEWHHTASDRAQALGEHHPDTLLARQLQLYAGGYQAWQSGDSTARRIAVAGLEMVLSIQHRKRGDDHKETIETHALLAALRGDYSPGMMWPEDLPRPGAD